MTERNALEELARIMDEPVDMASIHDRGLVVLNERQFSAYKKAQRIIAKLSKVEDWVTDSGADEPMAYSSISAVKESREIAEEGDGQRQVNLRGARSAEARRKRTNGATILLTLFANIAERLFAFKKATKLKAQSPRGIAVRRREITRLHSTATPSRRMAGISATIRSATRMASCIKCSFTNRQNSQ